MAAFPLLQTGAILQYPAIKAVTFATRVYRFVDGTEQRYREHPASIRRWVVRLDLLSEPELARLEAFFVTHQGGTGTFEFTDPWDDTVYPDCSFENDTMVLQLDGEGRARTNLVVRQNTE